MANGHTKRKIRIIMIFDYYFYYYCALNIRVHASHTNCHYGFVGFASFGVGWLPPAAWQPLRFQYAFCSHILTSDLFEAIFHFRNAFAGIDKEWCCVRADHVTMILIKAVLSNRSRWEQSETSAIEWNRIGVGQLQAHFPLAFHNQLNSSCCDYSILVATSMKDSRFLGKIYGIFLLPATYQTTVNALSNDRTITAMSGRSISIAEFSFVLRTNSSVHFALEPQ